MSSRVGKHEKGSDLEAERKQGLTKLWVFFEVAVAKGQQIAGQ